MSTLQAISLGEITGFQTKTPGMYQLFERETTTSNVHDLIVTVGNSWSLVGFFEIADNEKRDITLWLDDRSLYNIFSYGEQHVQPGPIPCEEEYRPSYEGLKYSYEDFSAIMREKKFQLPELILRASNCIEILVVCARKTDKMAHERTLEFREKYAHEEENTFCRIWNNAIVDRSGEYEYKCYFVLGDAKKKHIYSVYMKTDGLSWDGTDV